MRFSSGASGGRGNRVLISFSLFLLLLGLLALPNPSPSLANGIYTVNTAADTWPDGCHQPPAGDCTLREAFIAANGDSSISNIAFNIPPEDDGYNSSTGVWSIQLLISLPTLTEQGTSIMGTTQTGNQGDTNPYGPEIEIDGRNLVEAGFTIESAANLIEGLVINRYTHYGIEISGSLAYNNIVRYNYIGTDLAGTAIAGSGQEGIRIYYGPHDNVIGPGNVISGNGTGVAMFGSDTRNNEVYGNYIGTDRTGTQALANSSYGIFIHSGPHHNTVGGKPAVERNIISGNGGDGIVIDGADYNTIKGNYIGTDVNGSADLGNARNGIYIDHGQKNTIGPDNIIAYNGGHGVQVEGTLAIGNTITQSSIHTNEGLGITLTHGGNNGFAPPDLTAADCFSATGMTMPGGIVEIFSDADSEGRFYEQGTFSWNGMTFTFYPASGRLRGPKVTATVTHPDNGNTSPFSEPIDCGCQEIYLPLVMKSY